jgi:hypothetical protein
MVVLRFSPGDEEDEESSAAMQAELKDAKVDETTEWLTFSDYHFDEDGIVRAVVDFFHRAFRKGRQLEGLTICQCTGRVDEILHAASSVDIFEIITLQRCSDISQQGFWSISSAIKFNRHLTRLDLWSVEVTRQQAAALGAGLITSNSQHFKELSMLTVRFADGAITELASGLKENSSLRILTAVLCNLGDAELAELVDAVKSHPSLKRLELRGNHQGQEHALVALGKVLASKSCKLETLEYSLQIEDDDTEDDDDGLAGGLVTLAKGLQGNASLRSLNLSSNELEDKDIDHLGQILETCKLQVLDLSDNRITLSGFVRVTQNIPKSLKSFDFSESNFSQEEAACHTLTLFEGNPQLLEDGFNWDDSESPMRPEIQHFKDFNRCGRILLAAHGGIPLSVWPIVLARANTLLEGSRDSDERIPDAIFSLLQGPALNL